MKCSVCHRVCPITLLCEFSLGRVRKTWRECSSCWLSRVNAAIEQAERAGV